VHESLGHRHPIGKPATAPSHAELSHLGAVAGERMTDWLPEWAYTYQSNLLSHGKSYSCNATARLGCVWERLYPEWMGTLSAGHRGLSSWYLHVAFCSGAAACRYVGHITLLVKSLRNTAQPFCEPHHTFMPKITLCIDPSRY